MKTSVIVRFAALALAASAILSQVRAADSIVFSSLYSFDGSVGLQPYGGPLAASDGKLYGITSSGNVIYAYTPGTAAPAILHTLVSAEGSQAYGSLIEPVAGTLVGETIFGGANGNGAIFSVNTGTGAVTVLHSATVAEPNNFGGTPFYASDGYIYVVSPYSGAHGDGGIVRVKVDGTGFNVIYNSTNADGQPSDGVIEGADGRLYGVTSNGGNNDGSIFAINKNGTGYTTLHSFAVAEGYTPKGGLLLAKDGLLYGMTTTGGANNNGSIYQIATDGTGFTKLHDFDGAKGAAPQGRLIQGADGKLYGVTLNGGDDGVGVIFRMNTDGTVFQVLHSLTAAEGSTPYGALAETAAGTFYGIAEAGGASNDGALFRLTITPNSGPGLPPVLKVSGPKTRTTTKTSLTLRGNVTDPDGNIPRVQVKVGSRAYKNAKGIVKWSFVAKLKIGRNVLKVQALDPSGARSPVQRIVVNRIPPLQ